MRALLWLIAAATLAALASGGPASPQSLGDAAQKEKKKRETKTSTAEAPKKVYTGEDLDAVAKTRPEEPASPPARGQVAPPTNVPAQDPPPSIELPDEARGDRSVDDSAARAADERQWRARKRAIAGAVAAADAAVDKAQKARDALGPVPGPGIEPSSWTRAANAADAWLAGAKETQKQARKAQEDFEEEARRAGIPPGWLR